MKKIALIGCLVLLLAGCDDLPIYGGEHGGDDWAATTGHTGYLLQPHGEVAPGTQH